MRYYATTRNFTALRDKVIKALFRQAFFLSVINFRYIQPAHNGFVKPLKMLKVPRKQAEGNYITQVNTEILKKRKGCQMFRIVF